MYLRMRAAWAWVWAWAWQGGRGCALGEEAVGLRRPGEHEQRRKGVLLADAQRDAHCHCAPQTKGASRVCAILRLVPSSMGSNSLAIIDALIEYSAQRQYAKQSSSCLTDGGGWNDKV